MEKVAMTVSGLLTDVSSVIGTVCETIAGNPLLAVFLGLGVVTAGAYAFRTLVHTAK